MTISGTKYFIIGSQGVLHGADQYSNLQGDDTKRLTLLVSFLALVAFAGSLYAQDPAETETEEPAEAEEAKPDATKPARSDKAGKAFKGHGIIGKLDKDADGRISKEEAGEKLAAKFDELDADADGFLTAEELKAVRKMGYGHKKTDKKGETPETPEGEMREGEKTDG